MVASAPNTIRPGSDEDSSKRRQILDGARKVFMDLGFDGASMNEIARSAGVSKGTLYVYFADKSRLFEAIVEAEALEKSKIAYNFDPRRDAETTLREFGQAYIGSICRPGGGSSIRTVMAIAERMPEVGRQFYENVLAKTINRLADYLQAHVGPDDLDDRRLRACRRAIPADVPGDAVSAVRVSGGAGALGGAHRASGRQRDADVSADVSGEACVSAASRCCCRTTRDRKFAAERRRPVVVS